MLISTSVDMPDVREQKSPFVARLKSRFHLPSSVFIGKRLNSLRTRYTQSSKYKMFCYGDACCQTSRFPQKNVSMYSLVTTKDPTQTLIGTNPTICLYSEKQSVWFLTRLLHDFSTSACYTIHLHPRVSNVWRAGWNGRALVRYHG